MICKNCNVEVADDIAFCPNCGASLKEIGDVASEAKEEVTEAANNVVNDAVESTNEVVDESPVGEVSGSAATSTPELEWGTPTLDEANAKADSYGEGLMDDVPTPEAPEPPKVDGFTSNQNQQSTPPPVVTPVTTGASEVIPGKNSATVSLVLGIVGTVGGLFLSFGIVSVIIGIIGIIFANKAKNEGFNEGIQKGGFILSIIAIIIGIIGLVACIACSAAIASYGLLDQL